ncbi:DUF5131 family protein [Armatimonas rosea]|uniref:Protein gp37 n=1 Tax=Armatimonas rosea TaxID=685828 RepID=A0A7W9SWP4_ARMRO|nr:phage Gp37/Gp68 family protein [Armatimonas rosea]MBB6053324.1 protein gp37 [Armatimonas rosea]
MAKDSKIEWTHHTFNPWRGCTKVSEGCKHCYAETLSKRNPKVLGIWGPQGTRVMASESMWREPLKWNEEARAAGERHRVFCASLADVFEGPETCSEEAYQVVREAREKLFRLIEATPDLDWLLLTKRPENMMKFCPWPWANLWPRNVWAGTSVENQSAADKRIPELLNVPAKYRFLSCEPLLGRLDILPAIGAWCSCGWRQVSPRQIDRSLATHLDSNNPCPRCGESVSLSPRGIHWVIAGGESGSDARPMHPDWARSLRDQCQSAGVSFFFKQHGEYRQAEGDEGRLPEGWPSVPYRGLPTHCFCEPGPDTLDTLVIRVGKKNAGRLLDGRTWDELPTVEASHA